jgi:tRNA-dihydrouridine synthase
LGRPWLFAHLMAQGDDFAIPGEELQAQWLLEHVHGLIGLDGEQVALLQARKLVAYYFPAVKLSDRQVMLRNQLATWVDLQTLVASMLDSIAVT